MPPSRNELLRQLSQVKTQDLLIFLGDDVIRQLATAYYAHLSDSAASGAGDAASPTGSEASVASSSQDAARNNASDRLKRPLNAFMAFRTYYLKLFPDVQQKHVSGFLTTLWARDPCRNKWILIAKVYSWCRDELSKQKVPLSLFLRLACPIMKIVSPSSYLENLGWCVRPSHDGPHLFQDEAFCNRLAYLNVEPSPSTELELLDALVTVGFLPEDGVALLQKLHESTNGIMTTARPQLPASLPYTIEKLDYVNTIRVDPNTAIRDLVGEALDSGVIDPRRVKFHRVSDINQIDHLSMQPIWPSPLNYYTFASTNNLTQNNTLPVDAVAEYEAIDIDNPFDVDALVQETEDSPEDGQAEDRHEPEYDSQADFHYLM